MSNIGHYTVDSPKGSGVESGILIISVCYHGEAPYRVVAQGSFDNKKDRFASPNLGVLCVGHTTGLAGLYLEGIIRFLDGPKEEFDDDPT